MSRSRAHIPCTNYRYLRPHQSYPFSSLSLEIIELLRSSLAAMTFRQRRLCHAVSAYMFSIIRVANSLVFAFVAPVIDRSKSYVTNFCAIVFSIELSINRAASFQPRKSNSITPERITDPGLITSLSAYFGAVPWVASKRSEEHT